MNSEYLIHLFILGTTIPLCIIAYYVGKRVQKEEDRTSVGNALQKAINDLKEKDGLIEWKEAVLTIYERLLYYLAEAFCGEKPLEH